MNVFKPSRYIVGAGVAGSYACLSIVSVMSSVLHSGQAD